MHRRDKAAEIILEGVYSFWVKTVLSAVSQQNNISLIYYKVDLVFDNARRHRIVLKFAHLMV